MRTQIIAPKKEDPAGPLLIPTLQVIDGPRMGSLHRFNPREENGVTVGRTQDSEFVLNHPTLSRTHAKFTWMRVGPEFHMLIEDLTSTNGTTINGQKTQSAFLKDSDRVALGDVVLRFQMLSPQELAERDKLIEKATKAEVDNLTGLGTRHYMAEMVPKLFAETDSRGMPLSLLVLDLDHFKRVNDTLGHQAGDQVLKLAGSIITKQIRSTDVAVRYGGEEMLVFLPGSNINGARLVADRIRRSIQDHDTTSISPTLKLAASIGVAQRQPKEDFESLLRRADEALYRAKSGGRNRVECSVPGAPPAHPVPPSAPKA